MKYIKINTPLQVVGGFSTAEAIVEVVTSDFYIFGVKVYKSIDAYNNGESPIQLKNALPYPDIDMKGNNDDDERYGSFIKNYLQYFSILKANEYDCEIVDTDVINDKVECNSNYYSAPLIDVEYLKKSLDERPIFNNVDDVSFERACGSKVFHNADFDILEYSFGRKGKHYDMIIADIKESLDSGVIRKIRICY